MGIVEIGDNSIQTTSTSAQLSLQKGASGEEFVLNNDASGNTGISTKGNIIFNSNGSARMSLLSTGSMKFDNASVWGTTASSGNLYVDPTSGMVSRSTATLYSTEEVDKKLAIKDKLIEKMSARLDKLEKRMK
jgi:hypothetical protein